MKVWKILAAGVLSAVALTGCGVGQQSGYPGMMDGQGRHQVSMMQGSIRQWPGDQDAVRGRQWRDLDHCWMSTGVLMHRWASCQRNHGDQTRSCRMFQR